MNFIKIVTNALLLALLPISASAATLTFETGTHTPFGSAFTGSVTESGFTYSTLSGSLFLSANYGNPGQNMQGNEQFGGGVLNVVSATSSDFSFSGTDFSVYGNGGTETLTVTGLLNGVIVGVDTYTLIGTLANGSSYNWTTESASALAGVTINDLQITLNADSGPHSANIDNLVLDPVAPTAVAPEPSSIFLLGTGILGTVVSLKRRIARY